MTQPPGEGQPPHPPGEPAPGGPSWGQPPPGGPSWGQPAPGQPTPGQPAPGGPSWGQPAAGGPSWGQPAAGGPSWGQPPPAEPAAWGQAPAWTGAPPPGQYGYSPAPNPFGGRPRPGIIPLRPIALGEIFDGAFQAIRSNPRTMLGFSAVVLVTTTLLALLPTAVLTNQLTEQLDKVSATGQVNAADLTAAGLAGSAAVLPAALLQGLAIAVLNAILVLAVSEAVLGRQIGPGALWTRVRRRIWAVLGLTFLTGLLILALFVALLVPGVVALLLGAQVLGTVLLVVGVLAGLVLAVWALYSWALAGPALLLEDQTVVTALRRSWRLVRGSWWRVFGILLLTAIIVGFGRSAIGVPFALLGSIPTAAGGGSLAATVLSLLIQDVGTIIAGTIFYPFSAAVSALLYIDLRMRREGLDVELMRATGG